MTRPSDLNASMIADRLYTASKNNPEGLLLLAAGLTLLLRGRGSARSRRAPGQARQAPQHMTDTRGAGGAIAQAADAARSYASDVSGAVSTAAGTLASSASDYAGSMGQSLSEKSSDFAQHSRSSFQGAMKRVLRDQPLVVGVIGLTTGAVAAALFPTSQFEKQTLGPLGESVAETAIHTGEKLKDATIKASESLSNAADDRGLNVDGLQEVAKDAASAFGDALAGKDEEITSPNASANKPMS
jgi:hypothetical protein